MHFYIQAIHIISKFHQDFYTHFEIYVTWIYVRKLLNLSSSTSPLPLFRYSSSLSRLLCSHFMIMVIIYVFLHLSVCTLKSKGQFVCFCSVSLLTSTAFPARTLIRTLSLSSSLSHTHTHSFVPHIIRTQCLLSLLAAVISRPTDTSSYCLELLAPGSMRSSILYSLVLFLPSFLLTLMFIYMTLSIHYSLSSLTCFNDLSLNPCSPV